MPFTPSNIFIFFIETQQISQDDKTYSVHSLRAAKSLKRVWFVISNTFLLLPSWISASAATALATTIGLLSEIISLRESRNPLSSTNSELMSCNLATQIAAVLRT